MTRKIRRRKVLKGLGVAGVAGLAGCAQAGDDTPTEEDEADGGGDGADGDGTDGDGTDGDGTDGDGTDGDGDGNGGGDASRTIRMGILMGVTGGLSELGPPIRQAAEVAAEYVDEESDTFSVEYDFEDTATDPNTGISGANALVDADYPMIAGALSSTVTIQTANNSTVPNGVVQCSPASTSPAITDLEDNGYLWRTTPGDGLQAEVMTTVGRDRLDGETTATLSLNNDYGQGLAEEYASAWEDAGGTVQNEVSFEPGQGSYTSQLSSALQDEPDVLMIVGYPESGVQIFRDFYGDYSQDFCDIVVPDGLQSGSLPGDVGNSMRNVWGTAPSSTGPGRDAFESIYQDAYDSDPAGSPFTAQSFDAAAVLLLANAAAGENDGEAVRDQMANVANDGGEEVTPDNLVEGLEMAAEGTEINYQGASSDIQFNDNGDIGAATYQFYRYNEDGFEVIEDIEYSQ
ncbi:ABC transporter substrate-binding protein [Halosimplex salinum]|uniref:ABC transporter substrate-binding protein n=1 Tax=Halosimplex salinum TaxID=1710538 RepID=UPI000F49FCF5|nr:ABC transporter substrate-binding protein [Halosimplex salinum]